jgi:hypothetical protein
MAPSLSTKPEISANMLRKNATLGIIGMNNYLKTGLKKWTRITVEI